MIRTRVILILLIFTYCIVVSGSNYYIDSESSLDPGQRDGLSPATAWKTIADFSSVNFTPGDSILFKRGGIWRETLNVTNSGTPSNYIIYATYGNGPKPKILGSTQLTGWTNEGGNIWRSTTTIIDPYKPSYRSSEIFFEENNGKTSWGEHVADVGSLTKEHQWTWSSDNIYVYAPSDPTLLYMAVEVPVRDRVIYVYKNENIAIIGLDLKFAKWRTVDTGPEVEGASGLTIEDCHLSFCGTRNSNLSDSPYGYNLAVLRNNLVVRNTEINDGGRRGISIHIYDYSGLTFSNLLFEGNTFHDGYHGTGIGIAMDGARSNNRFENVIIRNNLFYEDTARNPSIDGFDQSAFISLRAGEPGSSLANVQIYNNVFQHTTNHCVEIFNVDNVTIYNNTFYDFNHHIPRPGNLYQVDISNGCSNVDIKNNIFYGLGNWDFLGNSLGIYIEASQSADDINLDYNLFYKRDARIGHVVVNGVYYRTTGDKPWSAIKTDLGWQLHEPGQVDPLFVGYKDCHLTKDSPAIGAGIHIPTITTDYDGNIYNDPPSIGAYEGNPIDVPPVPPPTDGTRQISLTPNPTSGLVNVLLEGFTLSKPLLFRIFDLTGSVYYEEVKNLNSNDAQISLNLTPGYYVLQVIEDDLEMVSKALVVIK